MDIILLTHCSCVLHKQEICAPLVDIPKAMLHPNIHRKKRTITLSKCNEGCRYDQQTCSNRCCTAPRDWLLEICHSWQSRQGDPRTFPPPAPSPSNLGARYGGPVDNEVHHKRHTEAQVWELQSIIRFLDEMFPWLSNF